MSLSVRTKAPQTSPSAWGLVEEELDRLTTQYSAHGSPELLDRLTAALCHAETYINNPGFSLFAVLRPEQLTALYKKNNDRREIIDLCHLIILKNQSKWENLRKTCEATFTGHESRDKLTKKLENALTDAERLIINKEVIITRIKSHDLRQNALDEMNGRRNFIDAYRVNLLNNQKAAWEKSWNTVSQHARAYTQYNSKDKLNKLKSALNEAETIIASNSVIVRKIKNPAKQKDLLEEIKNQRAFIAANRMVITQTEKTAFSWCRLFARRLFNTMPAVTQNLQLQSVVAAPSAI